MSLSWAKFLEAFLQYTVSIFLISSARVGNFRIHFKIFLALCLLAPLTSQAFSLLGPLAPWMKPEVGFIADPAYDVGGPRNLGDEFRWNLPTLTYGFDSDFVEFFGTNGIAAVEGAIAFLNRLEPASSMDLSKKPLATIRVHLNAQQSGLLDLRTTALAYLLEQLGLAAPRRFAWVVNSVNAPLGSEDEIGQSGSILQRNFDPVNLAPSPYVSGARFSFNVIQFSAMTFPFLPPVNRFASPFFVDATQSGWAGPVADSVQSVLLFNYFDAGNYATGLTRDDCGGLKYLFDTNNVNLEPCPDGVRAVGGGNDFVTTALRPGRDKIEFIRFDPASTPITNVFVDFFLTNGSWRTQILQRVITAPDILFTAKNNPRDFSGVPAIIKRTGPNFSHTNETGPGILKPGVVIVFHKLGDIYNDVWWSDGTDVSEPRWGSFIGASPKLIIFPTGDQYQGVRTLSVQRRSNPQEQIEWEMRMIGSVPYAIESSPNLQDWNLVTNIVGAPILTFTNAAPATNGPFFLRARRLPQ